jgi:hypothetical protein
MENKITNNITTLISDPTKLIEKKYLVKGTIVFIMITVATFLTLFILNDIDTLLDLIYQITTVRLFEPEVAVSYLNTICY